MSREPATRLENILSRAKVRLIDAVTDATDDNVYISTIPEELPPNPDEVMFELSCSHNFSFDQDIIIGAGTNSLHTRSQLMVTVHVTFQRDEAGRDEIYLTDPVVGVCERLRQVLKAFAVHDLQDASGNELLSQPLHPSSGMVPPKDQREKGYVTLLFDMEFDWDMS